MKISLVLCLFFFMMNAKAQIKSAMTFNIRLDIGIDKENNWEFRRDKAVELLNFYNPDVFGVQEAMPDQVKFIDDQLGIYKYVGVGRDDGEETGEYSAIFYNSKKFNLVENSTFWLSETPDKVSLGWDAAFKRICTYALFETIESKEKVWVFNTHFDHKGEKAKLESMKLIINTIKEFTEENKYPVILMGDFNLTKKHDSYALINEFMDESSEISYKKHYGPEGTFNGFIPTYEAKDKIDYIFVSNLEVFKHVHIDDKRNNGLCISDHFPVYVEFELPNLE